MFGKLFRIQDALGINFLLKKQLAYCFITTARHSSNEQLTANVK